MERFFQITAVILAGIAAYFLWNDNADGAFVAAVFGAVSFFLSVRFQVKERVKQREEEENEEAAGGSGNRRLTENEMFDELRTKDEGQRTKDEIL